MFLTYKNGATKRNLQWILSEEEFADITSKNCYYCNAEPTEKKKKKEFTSRKMNGVDRVDPNIGYNPTNCVPCCKICNYMKQELS